MKLRWIVAGGFGALLLCSGVRFALSQTDTATQTSGNKEVSTSRMYVDVSLSVSGEALINDKELVAAITSELAKQNIAVFEVAVSRGDSVTISYKTSSEALLAAAKTNPVPRARLSIGATNNPHLPAGVYHYGIGLRELRESASTSSPLIRCQTVGSASNYSFPGEIASQVPQLIARYDAALAKRNTPL